MQTLGLFSEPVTRQQIWPGTWQQQLDQIPCEYQTNHCYSLSQRVLDTVPDLHQIIEQRVQQWAEQVLGITDTLYITESWINVYNTGDSIHQHSHPNSIVSGTWYWSTPETEIRFHKQGLNSSTHWTMKLDQRPTAWSQTEVILPVEQGDLLLWPSYLQHSTTAHTSEEPRKTLSFNAMPRSWGSNFYRVGEAAAQIPEREAQQRKIF